MMTEDLNEKTLNDKTFCMDKYQESGPEETNQVATR
jgi:hypothetical protein